MSKWKDDRIEHYFAQNPKSKAKFGLLRACIRGRSFEFLTASGVFSHRRIDLGTRLLAECVLLPKEGCVLDMGCGYGAVGIAAAMFNPRLHVVLVDVNARAIWLSRQNAERNGVRNIEVRCGSLYEPVEDLVFDCVFSNPPVSAGMETVEAIIRGAPKHLTDKGLFEMVIRSKVAGKRFTALFNEAFGNCEVFARRSGYRVLLSRKETSS
jgi:16S rRNA (guanine1207-N2)-methyltransferase